jgi:hypothetical protein
MKKPRKPNKPAKPKPPVETITVRGEQLYELGNYDTVTIDKLHAIWQESGVPCSFKDCVIDIDNDYYDHRRCWRGKFNSAPAEVPNPDLAREKQKFDMDTKTYPKRLKDHKERMKVYNEELKLYEAWLAEEEVRKFHAKQAELKERGLL